MPDQETIIRIEKLEQQLAALTTRVSALESPNGGSPEPRPAGSPSFQATIPVHDGGPFQQVQVTGSGFQSDEEVKLFVQSVLRFPGDRPKTVDFDVDVTADAAGNLNGTVGVECPEGGSATHTIRARGALSGDVEGDATVFC